MPASESGTGPVAVATGRCALLLGALTLASLLGLFGLPHAGHGIDWPRYGVGILLVYGTALLLLGFICFIVPPVPSRPLFQHLRWLGGFGLLHGSKELYEAWALATNQPIDETQWIAVVWKLAANLALFEFACRLWRDDGSLPGAASKPLRSQWLYGLLASLTMVAAAAWGALPALHITAHSLVALPGAALTAAWLCRNLTAAPHSKGAHQVLAWALAAYALLVGAVMEGDVVAPIWLATPKTFEAAAGVPVDLLLALCAGLAALALSRLAMQHLAAMAVQAERNATELAAEVERKTRAHALAQQALDCAHDAIAMSDAHGLVTYVNAAFLAAWDYRHARDVVGTHLSAHWRAPMQAHGVVAALELEGHWEGELEALRGDGCAVPMRVAAVRLPDADGKATAMMATFHDLTEVRRAQRAEREQRAFNEAILEHAGTMVLVLDTEGRIVRFNRACETVSGRRSEDVLGHCPWDLLLPPGQAEAIRQAAFVALMDQPLGHQGRYVNEWVATDGRRVLIDWYNTRVLDDKGRVSHLIAVGVDITERQRFEADLTQGRRRLNEAQRIAQVGSWELDLGRGLLSWSDEIFRLFEIDQSRFAATYEGFLGAIHPEDRDTVNAAFTRSLADRAPYGVEHRLLMADGRVKWVQERGLSEFDADGRPLRSMGTVQDITERVLARQSLRQTQTLLIEAERLAHLGNWSYDLGAGTAFWSAEQYRLLGFEPDAVQADMSSFLQAVHPDDLQTVQATLQGAMKPGASAEFRIGHRIRIPAGERHLELHGRVRFDVAGRALGLFGTSMDVTERRLRELELERHRFHLEDLVRTRTDELEKQGRRTAQILAAAVDGFFAANLGTQLIDVNSAFCQLLGYSRDELLMLRVADFQAVEDDVQVAAHAELIRRQGHDRFETRLRRKDGSEVEVEFSVNVVDIAGEELYFAFARDITTRRRAELALHLAREAAEQANRAKSDFLSGMSHELRTPMNAILGFSQILRMQTLPAEQLDAVSEIYGAGQHLLALIDDLLDLTRIEAGNLAVTAVPVAVAGIAGEALRIVQPMLEARGLELANTLPQGVCVRADPVRLRQVLVNLLSNAAKYNRPGGRVSLHALVVAPQRLQLRVSDTGSGIAPEMLPRLFKTFERLGAEHSEVEGSGIGLALSKQLAERMGGSLGVESRVGEGSTFWIELPLAETVADADADAAAAPQPIPVVPAAPFEVLYIEDNRANQKVVELTFQTRPHWRLRTASTGTEGLSLVSSAVPDAILLDVHLPDMDGFAVLQKLRADPRTAAIPVVALSADAMPDQIQRGLAAGFHDYLAKPLDLEQLLAVMSMLATASHQ